MASCSSLLSEEQFMCSICLEVFINPVTTQCGHNFCKACITTYWDRNDLFQCPMCKDTFDKRPDLSVNTFISEMAAQFRTSVSVNAASSPDQRPAITDVSCDVCTGTKFKALKSCLGCQTSYCETHLEPHLRVAAFKKHKLIDPVENLEDRMCKKHERPLQLFCRTDQTCVCQFCTETDHKTHSTVPVEEECEERKTQMKETDGEVQQMIQERLEKVQEIQLSVETSKRDTEREISDSVQVFTDLVSSIQRCQSMLIRVMEEKQTATEKLAECFIKELEQEITELKRRSSELEQLSHSEDHLHLLQSFTSLSTPPHTKDWSQISVDSDLSVEGRVRRAVAQLEDTLYKEMQKLPEVKLKMIEQCVVGVTLDPDASYHLSEIENQVRYGPWNNRPADAIWPFGLEEYSLSPGRLYYQVQVEGKADWDLGVARVSINRKGRIRLSPENGYWTIGLRNGDKYQAWASPPVTLSLREKPQTVLVFVDHKEGQVSFFNVETKSHIYSYTDCTFNDNLYPFFVVTPVNL